MATALGTVWLCIEELDKNHENTIRFATAQEQFEHFTTSTTAVRLLNNNYKDLNQNKIRIEYSYSDAMYKNYMVFVNTDLSGKVFYCFIDDVTYINDNTTEISFTIDVIQTFMFDYTLGQCYVERQHSESDRILQLMPEDDNFEFSPIIREKTDEFAEFSDIEIDFTDESYARSYIPTTYYGKKKCKNVCVVYYSPSTQTHTIIYGYNVHGIQNRYGDEPHYTGRPTATETEDIYVKWWAFVPEQIEEYGSWGMGGVMNDTFSSVVPVFFPISSPDENETVEQTVIREQIDTTAIYNLLSKIQEISGTVVSMQIMPAKVWYDYKQLNISKGLGQVNFAETFFSYQHNFNIKKNFTFTRADPVYPFPPDEYTPKNNRLYSFPYNYFEVTNNSGASVIYQPQKLTGKSADLTSPTLRTRIMFSFRPISETLLGAMDYDGSGQRKVLEDDKDISYENSIKLPSTLLEPIYSLDYFSKWNAENKSLYTTSLISSAIGAAGGIVSLATGNIVGGIYGISGSIMGAARTGATIEAAKSKAAAVSTHSDISYIQNYIGRRGFTIFHMQIPAEYARIVDDYFTMFGYSDKTVHVPNIWSRPKFTYVKTQNCLIHKFTSVSVTKGIPAKYEKEICDIFDNGIRFWDKDTEIGDYSVNNSPTTP